MSKHEHHAGKSETFSKGFLDKSHKGKGVYDAEMDAQAHEEVAAAIRKGNAVTVTRRIADMEEASDGSGAPAQLVVLEVKFPHGKPTKTVG